jgi:Flp pilus assembly pilin Flp
MKNWCVRRATRVVRSLVVDDEGQDLIEYALLTGLVSVAFAIVFPIFQVQMATAYQAWLSNADSIWEPPPPSP